MDFHMHSQMHSFCSMFVHGNTLHSLGTPSLLRVPLLLFQQVDCCSGHTQRVFLCSVRCTLTDLSLFHSARGALTGLSCFFTPAHSHGVLLLLLLQSGALSQIPLCSSVASVHSRCSCHFFFTVAGAHSRPSLLIVNLLSWLFTWLFTWLLSWLFTWLLT